MTRDDDYVNPFGTVENGCPGCYQSFSGPWCDNCDTWPCECQEKEPIPA